MEAIRPHGANDGGGLAESGLVWRFTGRRTREAGHNSAAPRHTVARDARPAAGESWLLALVAAAMIAGLLIGVMAFYTVVAAAA